MKIRYGAIGLIVLIAVSTIVLSANARQGGGPPNGEEAGNCLSFPVIWAENIDKVLPGTNGQVILNGEWWYWWGTTGEDPNVIPLSCAPDLESPEPMCDDGTQPEEGWVKAYLQKDSQNLWQAYSATPDEAGVANEYGQLVVDKIDWGDNLESVDWSTRSQVRTEVVLYKELPAPVLEYQMRHTSGWGINEVHGLAVDQGDNVILGPGTQATVYSHCARLTIQKLLVERDDPDLENLVWDSESGHWTNDSLVNAPIFNDAVHDGGDGPGDYSAEINVKGKIIYGYTWNVRRLNEGAGDYRITFSLDDACGSVERNTLFVDGVTSIIEPAEGLVIVEEEATDGGGTAVLDTEKNLTYIDVRIYERGRGNGGGIGGGRFK